MKISRSRLLKNLTAFLLAVLTLTPMTACGGEGSETPSEEKDHAFSVETSTTEDGVLQYRFIPNDPIPEAMDSLWICPKSLQEGVILEDFIPQVTNAANWPTLLGKTKVLKLYIEYLSKATPDDQRKLGAFIAENDLRVAVEIGGIRMAPSSTADDKIGVAAAEREYLVLKMFIALGGRVDYVTTDHSMMAEITSQTPARPNMVMADYIQQQMEYFLYLRERLPDLKVGLIESLGYFWIKGDRQYEATVSTLKKVDFEEYMSEYVRIAGENGVTIDHFHVDFGKHDVEYDRGYGRILAAEAYVRGLGLDVGFIAGNAFHDFNMTVKTDMDIEDASRSAAIRTLKYFESYMEAGGQCDYLVFQRWQPYPMAVGDENTPFSNFGIFKSLLDSALFPHSDTETEAP